MPYVTLHRIVANADAADGDGGVNGDQGQGTPQNPRKQSNDSSYAYDFVALLENNTRLQVMCYECFRYGTPNLSTVVNGYFCLYRRTNIPTMYCYRAPERFSYDFPAAGN